MVLSSFLTLVLSKKLTLPLSRDDWPLSRRARHDDMKHAHKTRKQCCPDQDQDAETRDLRLLASPSVAKLDAKRIIRFVAGLFFVCDAVSRELLWHLEAPGRVDVDDDIYVPRSGNVKAVLTSEWYNQIPWWLSDVSREDDFTPLKDAVYVWVLPDPHAPGNHPLPRERLYDVLADALIEMSSADGMRRRWGDAFAKARFRANVLDVAFATPWRLTADFDDIDRILEEAKYNVEFRRYSLLNADRLGLPRQLVHPRSLHPRREPRKRLPQDDPGDVVVMKTTPRPLRIDVPPQPTLTEPSSLMVRDELLQDAVDTAVRNASTFMKAFMRAMNTTMKKTPILPRRRVVVISKRR